MHENVDIGIITWRICECLVQVKSIKVEYLINGFFIMISDDLPELFQLRLIVSQEKEFVCGMKLDEFFHCPSRAYRAESGECEEFREKVLTYSEICQSAFIFDRQVSKPFHYRSSKKTHVFTEDSTFFHFGIYFHILYST